MINVLIVDDERHSQDTLEMYLERYFPDKFQIISKCFSVDEALIVLQNKSLDLVFLDVQMPHKSGFDFLEMVRNRTFEVVFITAHRDYAVDAFQHAAFDYLLKPIGSKDFQKTILRFLDRKFSEQKLMEQTKNLDITAFSTSTGTIFLHHSEILYCKADKNYTELHTIDGESVIVSKSLGIIEERLPKSIFVRIHQSILVNVTHVRRYDRAENYLYLKNNEKLSVAIRKKNQLQRFE